MKEKQQRGGFMLPFKNVQQNNQVFLEFLQNSNITFLAIGASGIILKATLNAPLHHNFMKFCPDETLYSPVEVLLLKLCLIHPDNAAPIQLDKIASIDQESFRSEINIQTDIYLKTIEYLQPLCPGIVYSNIIDTNVYNDSKKILSAIYTNYITQPKDTIRPVLRNMFFNPTVIGMIGMEFISDGSTLHQTEKNEMQLNIGRFALLELALKTGYNHNDFHPGNIMLENNPHYFKDIPYRPFLIDFGRTTKIPPNILHQIKAHVQEKNYIEAFKLLCHVNTSNEFVRNPQYNNLYGWVCGNYHSDDPVYTRTLVEKVLQDSGYDIAQVNVDNYMQKFNKIHKTNLCMYINEQIQELYDAREQAIDENIQRMDELHQQMSFYPLLPIQKRYKNLFYEGSLTTTGGRKKRHTYTKVLHPKPTQTRKRNRRR